MNDLETSRRAATCGLGTFIIGNTVVIATAFYIDIIYGLIAIGLSLMLHGLVTRDTYQWNKLRHEIRRLAL